MNKKWRKEEGAIIVVAIFVVLALVVVGSLATMLTTVELDISKNDKMAKEAFFAADAGNPIATKILREMILNEGIYDSDIYPTLSENNISFTDAYLFLNEVRNYKSDSYPNDRETDDPDNHPDITAEVADRTINIDVDWRHVKSSAGGSILFAMGYEGIGVDRSHGGVKTYYDIHSKGRTRGNTAAEVRTVYLSQ